MRWLFVMLLLPLLLSASIISHGEAVKLAREGDIDASLAMFDQLRQKSPDNSVLLYDQAVVHSWAGQDSEVTELAKDIDPLKAPDYVIKTIAKSARNLQQYKVAASFYDLGVTRFPDNPHFYIGLGYVYADQKRDADAKAIFAKAKKRFPDNMDIPFEEANMYEEHSNYFDAMLTYQELTKYPEVHDKSVKRLVPVLKRLGMPFVAQEYVDENPTLFSKDDAMSIASDQVAYRVRWDKEGFTDQKDYAQLESTLAEIETDIAMFSEKGEKKYQDRKFLQLNFDKIIALNILEKKEEVVALYESLLAKEVTVPLYVQTDVADAYLALKKPEVAQRLLEEVVAENPRDFKSKVLLFYAYSDGHEMYDAAALARTMDREEPFSIAGERNERKVDTHLISILATEYAGYLQDAQDSLEKVVANAPGNSSLRTELANNHYYRGWNDKALEQFQIVLNRSPDDFYAASGKIGVLIGQNRYEEAKAALDELAEKNPKQQFALNRLKEGYEEDRNARFYIENSLGQDPGQFSQSNNQSYNVQGYLYTPLIDDNWRGFVYTQISNSEYGHSRNFTNRRYGAGVNYRDEDFDVNFRLAYNTTGVEELTYGLDGSYRINDELSFYARYEKFSADTPLRAIARGITADSAMGGVTYRVNESRESSLEYVSMDFEDDNHRQYLGFRHFEKLIHGPYYNLDTYTYLNGSRNTKKRALYYNPKKDAQAGVKANNVWQLFHYQDIALQQIIGAEYGTHYEDRFGSKWVGALSIEQQWQLGKDYGLGYGYTRRRGTFDGHIEYGNQFYMNLNGRF